MKTVNKYNEKKHSDSIDLFRLIVPFIILVVYIVAALMIFRSHETTEETSRLVSYLEKNSESIAEAVYVSGSSRRNDEPDKAYVDAAYFPFYFRHLTMSMTLNNSSSYSLIDPKGFVITSVGTNALKSGEKFVADKGFVPDAPVTADKLTEGVAEGRRGRCYCTVNDIPYMLIYRPIGDTKYSLFSFIPQSYIIQQVSANTARVRQIIRNILVAIAIFSIVMAVLYVSYRARLDKSNLVLVNEAETDQLTKLFNKISTQKYIEDYLVKEESGAHSPALFFLIDIDNFKNINDTRGHAFGDEVLSAIGTKLSTSFRASDIAGRIGGDEFLVFIKNVDDDSLTEQYCSRVSDIFSYFTVGEYTKYTVTASIGMSKYPDHGSDFMTLYKNADRAVYVSKKNGKNRLTAYNSSDIPDVSDEEIEKAHRE